MQNWSVRLATILSKRYRLGMADVSAIIESEQDYIEAVIDEQGESQQTLEAIAKTLVSIYLVA